MRNRLTSEILRILKAKGALKFSALLEQINQQSLDGEKSQTFSRRVYQTLHYLIANGLIHSTKKNKRQFVISPKGVTRVNKIGPQIVLKKSGRWDKRFFLVAFDIPLAYRSRAEAFRRKLKELNFYQLQRSLWVYPYNSEEEVALLARHCGVAPYITTMVIEKISNNHALNKAFRLGY